MPRLLLIVAALIAGVLAAGGVLLVAGALTLPGSEGAPGTALRREAVVVVAAGEIADCRSTNDDATADLLDRIAGTVLVLGDLAYPDGDFAACYEPTWGRHLDRTLPVPGNHEYLTGDAGAYFEYFGTRAGEPGKGWYSVDLGSWHLVALNSECSAFPHRCREQSEQAAWLKADLAATDASCVLAFWHRPRFSSGHHGDQAGLKTLWRMLDEARADLVLAAHDPDYERFGGLNPDGQPDPDGMPSFVVGTGGAEELRPFATIRPGSEARDAEHHGVLRLVLEEDRWSASFIDTDGLTRDASSGRCRA